MQLHADLQNAAMKVVLIQINKVVKIAKLFPTKQNIQLVQQSKDLY